MKYYLITDPKYYSSNLKIFESTLHKAIKLYDPDILCFRDKSSFNIEELISSFVMVCKENKINNIFINTYIHLAKKYNAKGVHLTSTQFDEIKVAKELGLEVIISCHNDEDIENAINQKADAITYSPIFETPNKGEPKGLEELERVIKKYDIDIIALGGIVSGAQINELSTINSYGFASIRYYV